MNILATEKSPMTHFFIALKWLGVDLASELEF